MRDPFGIVGTTIDRRYAIRRVVAEGGFGVVYEAEAVALGVKVAIKVLKSEMVSSSPEALARFEQEARLLARLRHPAIVSLTDAAHLDDGTPYLALEWIEGETLDAYLERVGPLPLEDALRLLGPVASAIAYAHDEGVVHRDLKPGNVMIGRRAGSRDEVSAKVLDFGVARWTSPHGVRTTTTSNSGLSIGFAAPEQYGKEFGPVDGRADQFALAAIVYAALTALPPFAGDSLTEVMFATCMAQERPSVAAMRADLPNAVDAVVRRALAIRPDQRFATIREFFAALEEAARHGDAIGSAPTMRGGPPTRTAGALPEPATLPSPGLSRDAPRTQEAPSIGVAPTQRAPETGPLGTRPTGAAPSEPDPEMPPSSMAPSTKVSPATRWILVVAVLVTLGGAAAAAWPLVMPTEPTKPKPKVQPSTTKASVSASTSAAPGSCGALRDDEVCIAGGSLHRGPSDCATEGSDPGHKAACPQNWVNVSTFVLDRTEVSIARYKQCVAQGKCGNVDVDASLSTPIRSVAWADAKKFCEWDHGKRLPTDDEWELAAAGAGAAHREYPWGNEKATGERAVYEDGTTPAAVVAVDAPNKGATPDGVLHLAGNVAEWTATAAPASAPWPYGLEATSGTRRWVRGGAFDSSYDALRTWARDAYPEAYTSPSIGFRCARTLKSTP